MNKLTGGSDKQIAYAERIRDEYVGNLGKLASVGTTDSNEDRRGRSILATINFDLPRPITPAELKLVVEWLQTNTDARWWLDHHAGGVEGLIEAYRTAKDAGSSCSRPT